MSGLLIMMNTTKQNGSKSRIVDESAVIRTLGLDWPVILFFVLSYAVAWGAFAILGLIARQSGIEGAQTLLAMAESFRFGEFVLSVPAWLIYLLTRVEDFAFSIAGVASIAATAR
jgi:hypothetical protein